MKKAIIFLLLIALLAGGGFLLWQRDQIYRDLNTCLENKAVTLTLKLTLGEGEEILTGEYTLDRSGHSEELKYRYDRLAEFELRDGEYVAPASRVETVEGTARISDGKLILLDGKQVNIALESVTLSRMHFARSYFADVVSEEGSFTATVSDPAGFLGFAEACEEMQISLRYSAERMDEMTITYNDQRGERVTMTYTFTY